MKTKLYKYQATGNDFILTDGRKNTKFSQKKIKKLCNRHFGIGADGLIIIRKSENFDFKMEFFNPDGTTAKFCGNGGRCIVKFAQKLKIIKNKTTFEAKDGIHNAKIINNNSVELQMCNANNFEIVNNYNYINTGTHHVVKFAENINKININDIGKKIRYDEHFLPEGTNVNIVEISSKQHIYVRTYEKGVEAETLSCGTGAVAAALIHSATNNAGNNITVKTKGGKLNVKFEKKNNSFANIYLTGQAEFVFETEI